jgi:hypothetical protein
VFPAVPTYLVSFVSDFLIVAVYYGHLKRTDNEIITHPILLSLPFQSPRIVIIFPNRVCAYTNFTMQNRMCTAEDIVVRDVTFCVTRQVLTGKLYCKIMRMAHIS